MKYWYALPAFSLLALAACKKDKHAGPVAIATIVEKTGFTNYYVARVENPDPAVYNFLCSLSAGQFKPVYSCTDAVYITNLPANLQVIGKKIKFKGWKDSGQPALFSSVNNAHQLEIYEVEETN